MNYEANYVGISWVFKVEFVMLYWSPDQIKASFIKNNIRLQLAKFAFVVKAWTKRIKLSLY